MKYSLLLFYCLIVTTAMAQDYNKTPEFMKANSMWAFGTNAGYNLNTHTPFRQSMNTSEACASIADRNTGELLFYSDGRNCWNRTGALMGGGNSTLNGDDLLSAVQGACIVPFIDDSTKYYLFTLERQGGYVAAIDQPKTSFGRLFYSVVDMKLNGGLGKIPSGQRNILVDSFFGEMMISVPGNNCDVWLMTHAVDSPIFKAYNINSAGFNPTPVISRTGTEISGYVTSNFIFSNAVYKWGAYMIGSMAISPDRSKLSLTARGGQIGPLLSYNGLNQGAMVCHFNASTGIVSDAIVIDTIGYYGTTFSPDNSKLYLSTLDLNFGTYISQYDISNFNKAAVIASKALINSYSASANAGYGMKLYNDTIYMAFGGTTTYPYMQRINKPNMAGIACNFQDSAVNLVRTTIGTFTLPNEVVFPYPPNIKEELNMDTLICAAPGEFPPIQVTASSEYKTYVWNDGNTTGDRELHEPGTYWLKSMDGCHSRTDTFILKQIEFSAPVITINVRQLGTTFPYSTYQWFLDGELIPGATRSIYSVQKNGDYRVLVSKDLGCWDTSAVYKVTNVTGIADRESIVSQMLIYPNPASDLIHVTASIDLDLSVYSIEGKNVKQAQKAKQISLHGLTDGIYFLQIHDRDGNLLKVEKIIKRP